MILVLSSLLSLSSPIKVKAITKDRLVDFEGHLIVGKWILA